MCSSDLLSLVDVYPNPFVASAKVNYTTAGGHTLVQVFNSEGQVVKTLVDKELAAGSYQTGFENENYAPGLYYVRLQNNAVQQVKPAVIDR